MTSNQQQPTACKGCGKPIVFERLPDGRWSRPSDFDVEEYQKLGLHECANYKPKPKSFGSEKIGGVVTDAWTGTNKQGQMFQAKVNPELERVEAAGIKRLEEKLDMVIEMLKEVRNTNTAIFLHFGLNEPQPLKAEQVEETTTTEEEDSHGEEEYKAAAKEERERNASEYSF